MGNTWFVWRLVIIIKILSPWDELVQEKLLMVNLWQKVFRNIDNMERDSPICAEESRQLSLKSEASFQHLRHCIDMKSVLLQKLKYPWSSFCKVTWGTKNVVLQTAEVKYYNAWSEWWIKFVVYNCQLITHEIRSKT